MTAWSRPDIAVQPLIRFARFEQTGGEINGDTLAAVTPLDWSFVESSAQQWRPEQPFDPIRANSRFDSEDDRRPFGPGHDCVGFAAASIGGADVFGVRELNGGG